MRIQRKGLATALLVVLVFAGGCAGRARIYTSGLQSAADSSTEYGMEIQDEAPDTVGSTAGSSDGADGVAKSSSTADASEDSSDPAKDTESDGNAGDSANAVSGYVYVCGAVQNPGVYPMTDGMRVYEALELAGGFTEEADEQWLNQAEAVFDGQRLYVYTREETQQMEYDSWAESSAGSGSTGTAQQTGSGSDSAAVADSSGKININTADRTALMTLPGIGETKADAVISYREQYGLFSTIEDIQNVAGIKSAVFSKIKDLIAVVE